MKSSVGGILSFVGWCAFFFAFAVMMHFLVGCAPSGVTTVQKKMDTRRYQITGDKRMHHGTCESVTIKVKDTSRLYREEPFDKTVLTDIDCERPIRFETIRWRDDRMGTNIGGQAAIERMKTERPELFDAVYRFIFKTKIYETSNE